MYCIPSWTNLQRILLVFRRLHKEKVSIFSHAPACYLSKRLLRDVSVIVERRYGWEEVWMSGGVDEWRCGWVEVWMSGGVDEWRCGWVKVWFLNQTRFLKRMFNNGLLEDTCISLNVESDWLWHYLRQQGSLKPLSMQQPDSLQEKDYTIAVLKDLYWLNINKEIEYKVVLKCTSLCPVKALLIWHAN